jgi:hypothetical protein
MVEAFIEFPVVFLNNLNIFGHRKLKKIQIFIWLRTVLSIGGRIVSHPSPPNIFYIWQLNLDPEIHRCRFLVTRQNEVLLISRICILATGVS